MVLHPRHLVLVATQERFLAPGAFHSHQHLSRFSADGRLYREDLWHAICSRGHGGGVEINRGFLLFGVRRSLHLELH